MRVANIDSRALSLPRLLGIFQDTEASRACSRWNLTRGPISAAALELRRLGWSWLAADRFVDELSGEVHLREVPPGQAHSTDVSI